jgi:DNA-binding response OmpR family regulator
MLVAEDNADVGHLVAQVLRNDGHQVEECWTGAEALRLIRVGGYALVVLDAALTKVDGFSVSRDVRREGLVTRILMLGATTNVEDRVRGLDSGADDFLVKPFAVEELMARARALLRRPVGPRTLVCGDLEVDRIDGQAKVGGQRVPCTARELAVLAFLAERCGRVVTRAELLAGLWEESPTGRSNTLDVHLCHLRGKLGLYAWMIQTVRGKGYRLRSVREGGV